MPRPIDDVDRVTLLDEVSRPTGTPVRRPEPVEPLPATAVHEHERVTATHLDGCFPLDEHRRVRNRARRMRGSIRADHPEEPAKRGDRLALERSDDSLGQHTVAVRVVLLAHRMAMVGMRVPLQTPASVDVAVVPPQPEVQRAGERRDQRDVRERPADEVVAALRRPMDQVVEARGDEHAARLYLRRAWTGPRRRSTRPSASAAELEGVPGRNGSQLEQRAPAAGLGVAEVAGVFVP